MDDRQQEHPSTKPEQPARKPYVPPRLTEYGTVESLTAGSRSRQEDGSSGGFRRSG